MTIRRRYFLKSSGIAMVGVGSGLFSMPSFLARAAEEVRRAGKQLVVVFQRGAADGLNIVVPHRERAYYKLRPTIAIPPPSSRDDASALDLDGRFGLHPELAPFKRLFDAERLAIVTAVGSPDATRSHFDAQDFLESGTPGLKSTEDGWLNRYLQARRREAATSFRAVSVTAQLPRILAGEAPALAIPEISRFGLDRGRSGLESLYGAADDPLLTPTAGESFDAIDLLQSKLPGRLQPANGASYPPGAFGKSMRQIAQLIRSDVGLEIAFAETGGWDTHVNQGGARGPLASRLRTFASAIEAFVRDLGDRSEEVVVLTLSEFGRTAAENGNRGTDHGHANSIFVIGGGVRGGKVYGDWPGLAREALHEGRDLALTTDFRDVVGEVLVRHLGGTDLAGVFPGWSGSPRRFRGLFGNAGA